MNNLYKSYLFRVILIPAGVFLAVMFGGGSASGLEVLTYFTSSGPASGLVALAIAGLILGVIIFMVYELGRIYRAYDYHLFSETILGKKAAPLYEIFVTCCMFLSLAYATTAGATAMADHFQLSQHVVTAVLLGLVIYLTYRGRELIERSMIGTAIALLTCTFAMASGAMYLEGDAIRNSIEQSDIDFEKLSAPLVTYIVAIAAYVPIMLYSSRDLTSRKETFVAGMISGAVFTSPLLCMHLAFLSRYPQILEQRIPNDWIASQVMPTLFSHVFVIVLFIAILQTGVGLMQGFLERIDNWSFQARKKHLNAKTRILITTAVLISCFLLSRLGVVALLAKLYAFAFNASLVIFIFPLFTIGLYKIIKFKNAPGRPAQTI